jgi:hypothetical protein
MSTTTGKLSFKPGGSVTGTRTANKVAKGYEITSLEYSISTKGDSTCTGIDIRLRLTGYQWEHKSLDSCTQGSLVIALEELFQKLIKYRGNTSAEQASVEDKLFDDFIRDLPNIVSRLR